MHVSTAGLLVKEGEPITIPPLSECVVTREMLSRSKSGQVLIEFIGDEFKKCFSMHHENAVPAMCVQGFRLLKDSNPSLILKEKHGRHYLCPLTVLLFLLDLEAKGCTHLDSFGRANTFFCHSRKGDRVVSLIKDGSGWRAIANPVRLAEKDALTWRAGRLIFFPEQNRSAS